MVSVPDVREHRVVLRNIRWDTYERLLTERGEDRSPRYTYDRGRLEIVSPRLPEHERLVRDIESLVAILALETGTPIESFGETTFRLEELQQGFEPDGCFYIRNEPRVRGKDRIDLRVDPPPDLVVEIDITNPSIEKDAIYARIGVPEVWRCDRSRVQVLLLQADGYVAGAESGALPGVTVEALDRLLGERRRMGRTAWLGRVRSWAREIAGNGRK